MIGSSVEDLERELRLRNTLHATAIRVLRLSANSLERVIIHLDAKLDFVTSADVANLSYYLLRYNRAIPTETFVDYNRIVHEIVPTLNQRRGRNP